jgi:hypothetical protein
MTRRVARLLRFAFLTALAPFTGCQHDAFIGAELPASVSRGDAGGATGTGGTAGAKAFSDAGVDASHGGCQPVACAGMYYACGNCKDDDGDGLIDMADPDCLGPCQNDERTFANVRPGNPKCTLDCYFDQDNGSGNDDCVWSHECDPLEVAPDYPPEGMMCAFDPKAKLERGATCDTTQSAKCNSVCGPLTPNGCDCFGCCKGPGMTTGVFIGSVDASGNPSCDSQHIDDPTHCKPCTQVDSCTKHCDDPCQLCFDKRELPSTCGGPTPSCSMPECPGGTPPCGQACLPPCASGFSCITGCCIEPPR